MAEPPMRKSSRGQGESEEFPRLLGGRLCLHFANTVEGPLSDRPVDFLGDYGQLARWAWHAGALGDAELGPLLATAQQRPRDATVVFERAREVRGAIARVFRDVAHSQEPSERDLAAVRTEYAAAVQHGSLIATRDGYAWSWAGGSADLGRPLWPVVQSAVELLTGGDLRRVKECPGAGDCGWLFYDASRNAARRWCSMEGCGSRVKMRRHYARWRGQP